MSFNIKIVDILFKVVYISIVTNIYLNIRIHGYISKI